MPDERPQPTIIMTPPVTGNAHPRRPPAHRSVSLLHSPRKRPSPSKDASDSSSDSVLATGSKSSRNSPSSLLPLGRDSSGESSNADKWFEQSNNDVQDNSAEFADNDPPFFMRNSSSSDTPPDAQQQLNRYLNANNESGSLPLRTGLLNLHNDGSSTEDFRSVIDDLTIENKKLKRRLKKYEKLHDSHLRDEKLFEVRVHGLPAEKKRELEETLRKFAFSLSTPASAQNAYHGLIPLIKKNTTASSQASLQNPDSAYASMSASGQDSSGHAGGNESRHHNVPPTTAARRQNMHSNIHSYLHHIPEGLLPQPNPASMTERAKKKLVVRRLEQIFAGKGAALGGHQHSLQQQDVSHMAARADRVASQDPGERARQEGTREAHIMVKEAEDLNDPSSDTTSSEENANFEKPKSQTTKTDDADQRPTRPLDLDPHRAQVPEENMRYMRHLGFSPPDRDNSKSPEEGHGWIYLNLLINMAQLHTINVTDAFVRKALSEHSSKFELSPDGRKIRWKGSRSVTRSSSQGGGSSTRVGTDTPDDASPRKRPKLIHRGSGKSKVSQAETNKLVYTPLFFHKDSTDGSEDSSEEEEDTLSSPFPAPVAGDSSGMTSSGMRTAISTKKPKKQEDGPIIFYNNARFCTDLSGDRKPNGNTNPPPYTPATSDPVGRPAKRTSDVAFERRGPLANAFQLPEPMDLSDNPIPASMELGFPPSSPPAESSKSRIRPIDMEVTGIGGVWPADNFAITVQSRHARVDLDEAHPISGQLHSKHIPDRFAKILQGSRRKTRAAVHKQIVATDTQLLPPSDLPPAMSFMPPHEDSYDEESEAGDDMSVLPESPGAFPPSAAPQPVELHYTSSDEEEEDDDDDESDSSLDLLAAARELDPEAIREREREYDANMAERLAEEIPAGSSAATAGGGSGFASPASDMNRREYRQALREARARPGVLKRNLTTDSMKVQQPDQESSSEDGEDDEGMDDAAS